MSVNLYAVVLDSTDAARLAAFWADVLERPVDDGATEDFAAIGLQNPPERRPHWMFVKVPEGKTAKNRAHPDFAAADLDAEVKRITGLGATKKGEFEEGGARWVTLADPDGNEFDVVASGE